MRQPKWDTPIEDLREHLRFAVPLRAATLAHQIGTQGYTRDQATTWLTGEALRAGSVLGSQGDTILFSDGSERKGRLRADVTRTTDDLVTGMAAAALLAQLDGSGGVTVLGDHYSPVGPEPAAGVADSGDAARFHQILDEFEALMTAPDSALPEVGEAA